MGNLKDRKRRHSSPRSYTRRLPWKGCVPCIEQRKILTHVNGSWEDLALGQDGESVVKVCYVVLRLFFVKVVKFETLNTTNTSLVRFNQCYLPGVAQLDRRWTGR